MWGQRKEGALGTRYATVELGPSSFLIGVVFIVIRHRALALCRRLSFPVEGYYGAKEHCIIWQWTNDVSLSILAGGRTYIAATRDGEHTCHSDEVSDRDHCQSTV